MIRLTFLALMLVACSSVAEGRPVASEDDAEQLAAAAVIKFKLTTNKVECLKFDSGKPTQKYFSFSVRENHTSECGGDPQTQPQLFNLRVYRKDGKIASDVYSLYGKFKLVDHEPNEKDTQ